MKTARRTANHLIQGIGLLVTKPYSHFLMFFLFVTGSAQAIEKESLVFSVVQVEQLEYRFGEDTDVIAWDGDVLVGTDETKLRLQSEGEYALNPDQFETLEHQLLL